MTNQTDQPEPTDAEVIAEAETWAHGVRSGPNLTHYPDLRKDARRRLLVLARRGLAAEAARDDKGVSTPTSAEIAAMPARWRRYIMMLETDCDPSGTIRSEMHMREHVEALEARDARGRQGRGHVAGTRGA